MAEYGRPSNAMITVSQPREGHASEDDDEDAGGGGGRGGGGGGRGGGGDPPSGGGGCSALSVGTVRKPRGRPPGSKNKPKPPVVITRESEAAMHPLVLELAAGSDVLESVSAFALRRRVGVSVLSGSGTVANVALRHPTSHAATFNLSGRFEILSLAGTFLPPPPTPTANSPAIPSAAAKHPFTISLAGPQGQVIGGTVAGALTAAGPVLLVAASFVNPEFHRLPAEEDEEAKEEEEVDVKPFVSAPPGYGVAAPTPLSGPLAHDMVRWASHPPPHY